MGNGIAVILLYDDQTKFDKRPSTRGISRTAYLGRLIHTLSNMIDIVIIEEESDEQSVFDEDESDGSDIQGLVGEYVESDDYGVQDCEFESSDCPVAERCKDIGNGLWESVECGHEDGVQDMYDEFESSNYCQMTERCEDERNGCDIQGLGESKDTTKSGDFSDMYGDGESSDYQMAEEYCSQDEMDTNEDDSYTVVTIEET